MNSLYSPSVLARFHGSAGYEGELLAPLWDAAEEDGAQTFSSTYLLWEASFLQPVFKGMPSGGTSGRGCSLCEPGGRHDAESAPCIV